jgi:hypothetical protein
MNSPVLKLGRSLLFSAAPVREKTLAVFVVLCIAVNALIPKFAIAENDYSTLCKIMQSQSVLLEFFSFSTLPAKIVGELFNEHNPLATAQHKTPAGQDTKNTSNTSSDFSISASTMKDASTKFLSQRSIGDGGFGAVIFRKCHSLMPGGERTKAPPGAFFALFIILMFYFLRARSSLPDAAIFSFAKYKTQFNNLNWVFSLSNTNHQGSF